MSITKSPESDESYRVAEPMTDRGTMTLRRVGGSETYTVVEYVDDLAREKLAALEPGATVRVELARVNGDASDPTGSNVYAATRILPGSPPTVGGPGL